jgi:hypothetical protein
MIWPPASPDAIERLRRFAHDALRTELPAAYVKFLGKSDGLDFNGYVIYGATTLLQLRRDARESAP